MASGGRRTGAGRPRSTGRNDGPRTAIRWSREEYAAVAAAAGGGHKVASWVRRLALGALMAPTPGVPVKYEDHE